MGRKKGKKSATGATQFFVGQTVWPIKSCNGSQKFCQQGKVTNVKDGRVWVKSPGSNPTDYSPLMLSHKGP